MSEKVRTEAELESRLASGLAAAFPNIPRDFLVEQRRFKVRLGRETYKFDSDAQWEKAGRADILIFHGERPLAVVEVKREDLVLTGDDYEQAQSYANQLTPRPPLVVVTNGTETRVYHSGTGEQWSDGGDAEASVAALLDNAAKIAAADMRWAIEALMGRETEVWTRAVRDCTDRLLEEMTAPEGTGERPFARGFLFRRAATLRATKALGGENLFTIVTGPPICGKSSLLRELALTMASDDELAILMLRGSGSGLYQAIANLFAAELEWSLSADDVRQWLRRMSKGPAGPSLVLAVDGVEPGTPMAIDLEELATLRPGPRLKVVLTTDRPEGLVRTANGRTETALGANAEEIELGPLGLEEFRAARDALERAKIILSEGAEYAEDYRAPWILRLIYDRAARDRRFSDAGWAVVFPPSLGFGLVDAARAAHADQPDLLRGYRVLARDMIADDGMTSGDLALLKSSVFVIRRDALSAEGRDHLAPLAAAGWVRTSRYGRQDIVVPTIPAAFLVELADAVGEVLTRRSAEDPHQAGVWLGSHLDTVYLGDLVGAEAIRSHATETGGFNQGIILGLLSVEPQEELLENALFALAAPNGSVMHLKIEDGQVWLSDRHGTVQGEPIDLGAERTRSYANTTAWMILGQFARLPTAANGNDRARMDAAIILEIGKCPFPLVRANEEGLGHMEHDLGELGRVLCQDQGVIEAITQAMADLLSRPWDDADDFVDEVLRSRSLPLIHRLMIALRTVRYRQIPELLPWAHDVLENRVVPAVENIITQHSKAGQP